MDRFAFSFAIEEGFPRIIRGMAAVGGAIKILLLKKKEQPAKHLHKRKADYMKPEGLAPRSYLLLGAVALAVFFMCVCVGSVSVPLGDTLAVVAAGVTGKPLPPGSFSVIIFSVRLPRVLSTALVGAALALCGAAMQGLLRNPLADGSTMGVSTGAALGAVLAIALGLRIPWLPGGAIMLMAIVFAFLSLLLILTLAYKLDYSLATNTIILIGVIYSTFSTSLISLVMTFAGDQVKSITFWTMGSLAGSDYGSVLIILVSLVVSSVVLLRRARELNAFAVGEDNACHIGVDVRRVKLVVLITASALIGVCVSIGGTISFVGLIIPHIARRLTGPNHLRLLPATLFAGSIFLMLADLVARTLLSPLELPIGVVTSIIGSVMFVYIFHSTRKVR